MRLERIAVETSISRTSKVSLLATDADGAGEGPEPAWFVLDGRERVLALRQAARGRGPRDGLGIGRRQGTAQRGGEESRDGAAICRELVEPAVLAAGDHEHLDGPGIG